MTNISKYKRYVENKNIFLFFKRIFDILVSIIGILVMIVLTIVIKIVFVLGGDFSSIFFCHERIGRYGKKFKIIKYRTMYKNAEDMLKEMLKDPKYKKEWNKYHKFENDPRITKTGNVLRRLSLDEIPQFINILKGDMSLIGPRPLTLGEVEEYKENKYKLLSVRPGLSGWWAVNGRNNILNSRRMKLELYYIDHLGIMIDIKIFFKTFSKIITGEGAR